MAYRNPYERNRMYNQMQNVFPDLQRQFPNVPGTFILKVLSEEQGSENVKNAILQESKNIDSTESSNWIITYYKGLLCTLKSGCANPYCPYFHSKGESRRIYKYQKYSSEMCPKGYQCSKSDKCEFAHTINEVLYHPDNYRSAMCPAVRRGLKCPNEKFCFFYHQEKDDDQLIKEFFDAHNTLDDLTNEINKTEKEIMSKSKIEGDLEMKLRCICGGEKRYVRSPCGHGACENCKSFLRCKYCNLDPTQIFKINFD